MITAAARPDELRWARIFAVLSVGLGLTVITGVFSLLVQMSILSFTLVVLCFVNRYPSLWLARGQHRAQRPRTH